MAIGPVQLLVLGFNHLLFVAIAFYFLSYVLKPRLPSAAAAI